MNYQPIYRKLGERIEWLRKEKGMTQEQLAEKSNLHRAYFWDIEKGGNSFDTLYFKDGRVLERTSHPLIKNNEIIGRVWSFHDVTENKKAELLLVESENRFRKMFENGQFGIILVDANNKFIKVNPAFCKIVGYTESELLKMKFSDITSPDSKEKDIEAAVKLKAGKIRIYSTEKRYIKKNGGLVWVKIVVSVISNPDKSFGYFLTIIEDITDRKKAEILLTESNKMLNQIIETIPDRIFWKDTDLNYLGCNTIFARDAGKKSPKELIGRSDYEMGWRKQADLYRKDDANVIKSGVPKIKYQEPQTTPNGGTIWLETSKIPLKNTQNEIIGILGTYADITKRKSTEEALRKSEEKFSNIFQSSPYAITITRASDGKFTDVNNAFVALSGISRQKALASSSVDLGIWASEKDRDSMINELKTKGYLESREFPFRTKSKGLVTGLYSARMIEINGVPHVLSSIADITELKKAQELIIELESRNEATLTSIGDAVFSCDKDGRVLLFNKAAEKLTGIPAQQVVGRKYNKVITFLREDNEEPVDDFVSEAIKRKEIIKNLNHTLLVDKTGAKIPVVNSVAPIKKATGDIVGCVVSFRDITQERQIDRAKTEFVSLASHQLRTPLTAINWYCEMLLSEKSAKLTEKQKLYAKETYKASKRMVKLMDALLNVSRLEVGSFIIEPKSVKITDIVKVCLKDLKSEISKKDIVLNENYDPEVDKIQADPKLLTIILQNLLSNAVKYTPQKGSVDLKVRKNDSDIIISVSDTGVGIPNYQQEKIFTKLFRADNVKEVDPDGTGLGLYLVKTITDNSGGKVWFESEEDKGSTFYVSLPSTGMRSKSGTKTLV